MITLGSERVKKSLRIRQALRHFTKLVHCPAECRAEFGQRLTDSNLSVKLLTAC